VPVGVWLAYVVAKQMQDLGPQKHGYRQDTQSGVWLAHVVAKQMQDLGPGRHGHRLGTQSSVGPDRLRQALKQ